MNLRQLRYISEVARHDLNLSATADSLFTSQPGVSKQIRQLEDELGVQIFERSGRQLTRITPAGRAIIELADRALIEVETLKQAAQEYSDPSLGELSLAATHTVARYVFPPVVEKLKRQYPRVHIHTHMGTPVQIAELVAHGKVDFGIATEAMEHFEDLVAIPCYRWRRSFLVPPGHPLLDVKPLTLHAVAEHPLVTYVFGFDRGSPLDVAFRREGLTPEVAVTATDADIIKTYVRMGFGVGIVATLSHDADADSGLHALDASELVEVSTARLVFRRGLFFRGYMYAFLELFAPHLTRELIESALSVRSRSAMDPLLVDVDLPLL
jgi:LysR family cys regulon transcriptional activator